MSFDHPTFIAVDYTVLNTPLVFPRKLQHSLMLLSGTAEIKLQCPFAGAFALTVAQKSQITSSGR
jgi:hypothetical protein